jgi:putative DNA primase/helicase
MTKGQLRQETERFLVLLDEEAESFTFQVFDDLKSRKNPKLARTFQGTMDEYWNTLCQLNNQGAGVFVTVNATNGNGRKKEDITRVRAIWQEQDRPGCPELPTTPHIVVESSPGKHHRYILVDDCPLDSFQGMQDRMVGSYGSDPAAADISRVLRLPGFFHMKNPDQPHMVRIVAESGELPLDYEKAKQIFPPVVRQPRSTPPPAVDIDSNRIAEITSATNSLPPDIPYQEWLNIGMALHDAFNGASQGLAIWDEWSSKGSAYRPGECACKWASFQWRKGVTVQTVFKMAAEAGWRWQQIPMEKQPGTEGEQKEQFNPAAIIQQLAGLSTVEYEQKRKGAANALGMRATILDHEVKAARKSQEENDLPFEEPDPWPVPVNPDHVLTDIASTIQRFIVCSKEVAHAVALWSAMTWFMDVVQVAPLAVITAPEKQCGKTQLLTLLGHLSARAITASSISPAATYRAIDAWSPTLLIDEADAFMKDNEELRGIINSGHTRDSAYVIRTVGDNFTPTKFNTWGAKAISGIGHLADTLMDRAVILELRRKLPHESVDRLRYAEPDLFHNLRAKLTRFAEDYSEQVRQARPPLPESLSDRAQDNWEPLLAIAMVAGGHWLEIGTAAAMKLSGTESAAQSIGVELLADIQEVFEMKGVDRISTADLIKALCEDDEKVWSTYNRGNPIKPRQLATRLKGYGISSNTVRIGISTPKGFKLDQFTEAFSRYLAPPPLPSATPPQPLTDGRLHVADEKQRCGNVADKDGDNSLFLHNCCGVADRTPPREGNRVEVEI